MGWSQNPLEEAFPYVAIHIRHEMSLLAISFRDKLLALRGPFSPPVHKWAEKTTFSPCRTAVKQFFESGQAIVSKGPSY